MPLSTPRAGRPIEESREERERKKGMGNGEEQSKPVLRAQRGVDLGKEAPSFTRTPPSKKHEIMEREKGQTRITPYDRKWVGTPAHTGLKGGGVIGGGDLSSGGLHDEKLAAVRGALVVPLHLSGGLPLHLIGVIPESAVFDVHDSAAFVSPAVLVPGKQVRVWATDDSVPEHGLWKNVLSMDAQKES